MNQAPQPAPIRVQSFTSLEQFDQCVALEEAVWGYDPADMIPRRMFLLASRIGGQVMGAFLGDNPTAVGFAMALPAFRNGHAYLHSHMVGVLPEVRNRGIARALKLAQRDDALARGFDLMEWTFDPTEIKNAYINIAKLGAIVRRYQHNFYGPSSSPLQGGLPTDRVYAEWWLGSRRVERALGGEPQPFDIAERVDVPAEIYAWKASPPADTAARAAARDVQARNAQALESAFASGLAVLGYQRNDRGDGQFQLGRWDENHAY
ncbi:MAG TPA: GNAT family N-acetyltransferase [Acidobacteriaceae bacterium]|nr:GNAT family N-acetyltransferase [Acidobacteriaceae bacterium]